MVWRRDLYLKEGLSQLKNSPNSSLFYSKAKRNPINSFNETKLTTIKDEIEANNLPATATILIHLHPRDQLFICFQRFTNNRHPSLVAPLSAPYPVQHRKLPNS